MKRLIAMLVLFFIMIGFAVFEIVYVQKFYTRQQGYLVNIETVFDTDPENIDRYECVQAMQNASQHWKKGKRFVMMLGNHNASKFIDEKMVSLEQLIVMNQQYDAYVTLKVLQTYIDCLKDDVMPHAGNFL